MEGRPELPPLDPLRYGHASSVPPPFHMHTAGLLSASAAAHAFPYLSGLTGAGGNGLGALGGSPFRTPHSASSTAAMRQFWPPTPPPDGYGRYGAGYYSLFPPVGSLGSDTYPGHQAPFPRLGHGASPYSPVLDLHRDPNFLSPGLSLGSPLTPTNLANHVSPLASPLATSSLLSPPTASTPGGTSTDSFGSQEHSDGLLTTVHQAVGQRLAAPKTPSRDRSAEKPRGKKSSSLKAVPKDLSRAKETKPEPRCAKCSWNARAEVPPWPVPPPPSSSGAAVTTTAASTRGGEGGNSGTSLTFCMSLCIPSDQVSSTVPSPSAQRPSLLSPRGPPVVSSSTPDAEPAPEPSPSPKSVRPATPTIAAAAADGPRARLVATAIPPEKEAKALDLSDFPATPERPPPSPCSSTTADDARTASVSPMPAKPLLLPLPEESPAKRALPKDTPKKEEKSRPDCRYEPVASCVVKPRPASAYVPLNEAALMLSVQRTKVVSATRVRGCKTGGATEAPPRGPSRVQEVAPVNLKVVKPLTSESATPTVAGEGAAPTSAPEARKIVVEEKCDTTVSVVPALSVLNAANQHIPVGIAVARQRQDHTITCSKTSLSSSSSEQGQITAVSCSTVILTTGGSERTACISEPKHGLSPQQGIAEATTACLVAAGPGAARSSWDPHGTDTLGLRPATTTLRWLAAPPVASASPSVIAPTLWLDPGPASGFPLAPGGFQLARDAVTGQLYLVPATGWALAGPTPAPVQQILTQQHTTFQQILPDPWSTEATKPVDVTPKLEAAEVKDATVLSTISAAPQQPVVSYVYDATPPSAGTPVLTPVLTPPSKVSQGTSPPTSMTPSPPPPQQAVAEQGVQASDTDVGVDESDDDFVRTDAVHVTRVVSRVTSVTTAVQVDMDSQTMSDDNETDDSGSAVCHFVGTSDSANQTDDLPPQKEAPSSCDEEVAYEQEEERTAPDVSNRSSEVHFSSDSEIDDSIPVLTTQSSGVREFIDHHGLDLLVDSIEEYAAAQEAEEGMPQLIKSTSPAGSPREGGPPDLSADSPSSRPGEHVVRADGPESLPPHPPLRRVDDQKPPQSPENVSQGFESSPSLSVGSVTDSRVGTATKFYEKIFSETRSELVEDPPVSLEGNDHDAVPENFETRPPSPPSSSFWQRSAAAVENDSSQTDYHPSYHETYDGSCTDGLGLLCALAEQRFLEESRKEQEKPAAEPDRRSTDDDESDVEPMDATELEVRSQLADLRRRFEEKREELARLHPRKGLGSDAEEMSISKEQVTRPKKRRHSVATVESTSPSATLDKAEPTESDRRATDGFFQVVRGTGEGREEKSCVSVPSVEPTGSDVCESVDVDVEKEDEERQPCVPVLTIKFNPEQARDGESKFEADESESAGDAGPASKRRKKKSSSARQRKSSFGVGSPKRSKTGEEKDETTPRADARRPVKKNSRSKEGRRAKSFSEEDFWCVRRSERIFLLDAGVVSSSSLSLPDRPEKSAEGNRSRGRPEKAAVLPESRSRSSSASQTRPGCTSKRRQSSSPCVRNVPAQKKPKRELVSVLKKCRGEADGDSDPTENVPLSRLSSLERSSETSEQRCRLEPGDLHDLTRVVMLEDGLFYAGYINEIQAPDVYGITLDGERGNRPHIFSREEILKEAVREVKPRHVREVPEGRRVCAYWSQQYRCLYPGVVAKATSPNPASENTLVYVEFDDGDSGKIPLEDVRLLPQDYPQTSANPHPLLVLSNGRRRSPRESEEGRSKKLKKRKKSKKTKTKEATSSGHESEDGDAFGSAAEERSSAGGAKKRRHEHKHRHHHKHHRCHRRRKHRHRHKHQDAERPHEETRPGSLSASLGSSSERSSGCSANCSPSAAEDGRHPELTVRIRTSSTEVRQADSEDESDASEDGSGSSSDEDVEGRASSAASERTEAKKPAKRKERLPSVEKSKIAAFLPERQLWRWSGKSFRRPGTKGKAKKEYYKSICRGKETIRVGDCAVFLSTGRPNLPYIGRIETMWQSWGGNMIVRVKWFYHPDETKGLAKLLQPKGALFQSPHADENDVQTISHKCEVLSWEEYRAVCGADTADGTPDVYYLAGSYDPYANVISIEPEVKP